MAIQHFLRVKRSVRVGGPWRRKTVAVAPLPAALWGLAWQALRLLSPNAEEGTPESVRADLDRLTQSAGLRRLLTPLVGLVTTPSLGERECARMTPRQASAVVRAFFEVHDLDYLREGLGRRSAPRGKAAPSVPLEALAHHLVSESGGAYTEYELLVERPFAEFLAIAEASRMVQNLREGKPFDAEPIEEGALARFAQMHPGLEVE